MAINYADKYQEAVIDGFYPNVLYSSALWQSPSNKTINFLDAKHIKVPRLSILSGRQNRDRRTITQPAANYSLDYDVYELTNERYWSTLVDPSDIDESNQLLSIANITRQYNLDSKMPEKDREMFSKLFSQRQAANTSEGLDQNTGIHSESLDATNVLHAYDQMMRNFDRARIPVQGRILYVDTGTYYMLKEAEAVNRTIIVGDPQNINRSVRSLDEVTVVAVPEDLFQTKFDFTNGSKTVADAKQIKMMLIYNGVQISPEKYDFVGLDAPAAANSGNWLYYEQSYDDVLLLKPKFRGVEFFIAEKDADGSANPSERTKTVEADAKPNANNTVEEIKAYLDKKSIDYTGKTKKEDLLALVK
ncbi:capsid protein [Lactobacillus johnsonii]|uniref:capsid protein n=1 Tax=Lactobacillus johnsonii TaxID=33959 RepID=UPI00177F5844|nr:capsid protein [Lactobacillus johnsonii]QXL48221.1 capsid protein [Lactobacillus johnsonii]